MGTRPAPFGGVNRGVRWFLPGHGRRDRRMGRRQRRVGEREGDDRLGRQDHRRARDATSSTSSTASGRSCTRTGRYHGPTSMSWGRSLTVTIDELEQAVQREKPDLSSALDADGTVTIVFTDIVDSTVLVAPPRRPRMGRPRPTTQGCNRRGHRDARRHRRRDPRRRIDARLPERATGRYLLAGDSTRDRECVR